MVELKYNERIEAAELAGLTVAEVRDRYQEEGGIPAKAEARLNGRRINRAGEAEAVLNDDDQLTFRVTSRKRLVYMAGALLLALAITGGVFAYGYSFGSVTLGGSVTDENFAEVTANTSSLPSWTAQGMENHLTGSGTLFDVDTATSNYTGDFVATVSLANANKLAHVYRALSLSVEVRDSLGNVVDINADGNADSDDYTILTLNNGSVDLPISQVAADVYTIQLKGGYYICNAYGSSWGTGDGTPELFCEVTQQ